MTCLQFHMISCAERLPEALAGGLTSDTVLFLTEDGQLAAGTYHVNGFFYEARECVPHARAVLAAGSRTAAKAATQPYHKIATSWCYLRDSVVATRLSDKACAAEPGDAEPGDAADKAPDAGPDSTAAGSTDDTPDAQ